MICNKSRLTFLRSNHVREYFQFCRSISLWDPTSSSQTNRLTSYWVSIYFFWKSCIIWCHWLAMYLPAQHNREPTWTRTECLQLFTYNYPLIIDYNSLPIHTQNSRFRLISVHNNSHLQNVQKKISTTDPSQHPTASPNDQTRQSQQTAHTRRRCTQPHHWCGLSESSETCQLQYPKSCNSI